MPVIISAYIPEPEKEEEKPREGWGAWASRSASEAWAKWFEREWLTLLCLLASIAIFVLCAADIFTGGNLLRWFSDVVVLLTCADRILFARLRFRTLTAELVVLAAFACGGGPHVQRKVAALLLAFFAFSTCSSSGNRASSQRYINWYVMPILNGVAGLSHTLSILCVSLGLGFKSAKDVFRHMPYRGGRRYLDTNDANDHACRARYYIMTISMFANLVAVDVIWEFSGKSQ